MPKTHIPLRTESLPGIGYRDFDWALALQVA